MRSNGKISATCKLATITHKIFQNNWDLFYIQREKPPSDFAQINKRTIKISTNKKIFSSQSKTLEKCFMTHKFKRIFHNTFVLRISVFNFSWFLRCHEQFRSFLIKVFEKNFLWARYGKFGFIGEALKKPSMHYASTQ